MFENKNRSENQGVCRSEGMFQGISLFLIRKVGGHDTNMDNADKCLIGFQIIKILLYLILKL